MSILKKQTSQLMFEKAPTDQRQAKPRLKERLRT